MLDIVLVAGSWVFLVVGTVFNWYLGESALLAFGFWQRSSGNLMLLSK
jgi:hypothetical protein